MMDENTSTVAENRQAIYLNEDGSEAQRLPLDLDNKPYFDQDENLVIPFNSLKLSTPKVKETHYKIYLDKDENKSWAEIRTRGKVPKDSHRDNNGDTIIPYREPVVKTPRFKIFLGKNGEVLDKLPLGKGRMPKGAHKDENDNVIVPWHVVSGAKPEAPEAPDAPETPVVAEQPAPPVTVVESVEEPSDVVG